MPEISTKVVCLCDICGDEMSLQPDESYVCWRDQHHIPAHQLYRYAEHITVRQVTLKEAFDDCPF